MLKEGLNAAIKYRSDIDGLRAIAIISVIIFHFCNILPSGYIGVDVFFVISGFLITKIILKEHQEKTFSFVNFYIRRILRIFPALFLMLFVSFIFASLILTTKDMVWFSRSLEYSSLQISNLFFQRMVDYFDANEGFQPLIHTWSLGVEEQFYLIMPAIVIFLLRFKSKKVSVSNGQSNEALNWVFWGIFALSLLSLITSQILVFVNQKVAFYSLFSRFWELGIGCLLAFSSIKISPKITNNSLATNILAFTGLAVIGISAFVINYSYFPGFVALFPCLGAALVILSGQMNQKTFVARFLSISPLVFIGKISYSLYLWHLPLLTLYKKYQGNADLSLTENLLLIAVLLVISILSWKFVELPFRRKVTSSKENKTKPKFSFKNPFIVALACILVSVAISKISKKTNGLNFRLAKSELINEEGLNEFAEYGKRCGVGKRSDPFPNIDNCVIGDNQKEYEVALFGDSHAGHYSSAVTSWAQKNDLSIMSFYLFLCPPMISDEKDSTRQKCKDYRQEVKKIVKEKEHIKYIVIASMWQNVADLSLFKAQIEDTLKYLSSLDKKIIVMGAIPDSGKAGLKASALECIESKLTPIERLFPSIKTECESLPIGRFSKQFEYARIIKETVSKYENTSYFEPFKHLCDKERCYFVENSKILYADQSHFNKNGAQFIEEFINF